MRRGTAASWTAANPTLDSGEGGFETDTKKLKVGDGSTAWNSLAYIGGSGSAPDTADFLVGTAQGGLSAEIVVGTTPGGELGGTWAFPTVDATHSGSAHTDFIAKAIIDAKGDLIAGSAADTPVRLAISGSDGDVLTKDAAETTGMKWATPTGGAGSIEWEDVGTDTSSSYPETLVSVADRTIAAATGILIPSDYEIGSGFVTEIAATGVLEIT